MALESLDHCAIRTTRLEETRRFYVEALGLEVGPRPPLSLPGYWLYAGGRPIVHLMQIGEHYDADVFENVDYERVMSSAGVARKGRGWIIWRFGSVACRRCARA